MKLKETLSNSQKIEMFNGSAVGFFPFLILPQDKFYQKLNDICMGYYTVHSGEKEVSSTYKEIIKTTETESSITKTSFEIIGKIIRAKFIEKWVRIYEALIESEYNALYDKEYTHKKNGTNTDNTVYDISIVDNGDISTHQTETSNGSNDDKIYGFNSSVGVNDSSSTDSITRTTTAEREGNTSHNTNEKTGTENKTFGIDEEIEIKGRSDKPSDLIKSEVILRNEQIFFDIIYSDIDSITALQIYI